MQEIIQKLTKAYPGIHFVPGDRFTWSYQDKSVTYVDSRDTEATWSLLHEVGHAGLSHSAYSSDIELLQKEVAAWEYAKTIAVSFALAISEDYIEDCIDTYRDWINRRSTCPTCSSQGLQERFNSYSCINCQQVWQVNSERSCRPYRSLLAN